MNQRFQFGGRGPAHRHARAVIKHQVQRFDVVHYLAGHQPMSAATVVADHAAQCAARVRRRVGAVGQVVHFGGIAQPVEDDARFYAREFGRGVNQAQLVHIPRKIEDHRDVGALACEAGARAARQHGSSSGPASG